eukprot:EG_transcript_4092
MTAISGSMEYRRHHTNANHSPVANGNVMDTAVERASSTPHSPRLPAKHLTGLSPAHAPPPQSLPAGARKPRSPKTGEAERHSWVLLVDTVGGPLRIAGKPPVDLCSGCEAHLRTAYDGQYQTVERLRQERQWQRRVQEQMDTFKRMYSGKLSVSESVERLETQLDDLQEAIDLLLCGPDQVRDAVDPRLLELLGSASSSRLALQRQLEEEQRQNHLLEAALQDLQRSMQEEMESLLQENARLQAKLKAQSGSLTNRGPPPASAEHTALQQLVTQLQQTVVHLQDVPRRCAAEGDLQAALAKERQTTAVLSARVDALETALEYGKLKEQLARLDQELAETKKERDALRCASEDLDGSTSFRKAKPERARSRHVRWVDARDDERRPPRTTSDAVSESPSELESVLISPRTPTPPSAQPPPIPDDLLADTESDGDSDSTLAASCTSFAKGARQTTGVGDWVCSAAFSPDRKYIATGGSDGLVHVREVQSCKLVMNFFGHDESVTSITFSADGQLIASGGAGGLLVVFDLDQEDPVRTLEKHSDTVCAVAFSPDGRRVASGDSDGAIWITAVASDQADCLTTTETDLSRSSVSFFNRDSISSLAFSLDGAILASGGAHCVVQLWDTAALTLLGSCVGHTDWVNCLAFSPDQRSLLSGGSNGTLRLWDVGQQTCLRQFVAPIQNVGVEAATFAPDGQAFLTGDTHGCIRLWSTAAERSVKRFPGHSSAVCTIGFTPDGAHVLSLSTSQWGAEDSLLKFSLDIPG